MNNIKLTSLHSKFIEQPILEDQKEQIETLNFFHGVCHNNKIYGIPFCSNFVLEISTSKPLKVKLFRIPKI